MNMKKNSTLTTTLYCTASALWRLLPHWPNIAPFTALALYTGSQKRSWTTLILPLIPLTITDLYFGLHTTMPFVYGSMLLIALLGSYLPNRSPITLAISTLASSALFFAITNLGTWLTSGLYPLTAGGLVTAYTLAIPFYQNALIGDLAFSTIFFGYAWLMEKKSEKALA